MTAIALVVTIPYIIKHEFGSSASVAYVLKEGEYVCTKYSYEDEEYSFENSKIKIETGEILSDKGCFVTEENSVNKKYCVTISGCFLENYSFSEPSDVMLDQFKYTVTNGEKDLLVNFGYIKNGSSKRYLMFKVFDIGNDVCLSSGVFESK